MKSVIEVAKDAAKVGAELLGQMFLMPPQEMKIEFKAADGQTPRTIIDLAVGQEIQRVIRENFPGHSILDEETGLGGGASDYQWIIDPFDGTSNLIPKLALSVVGVSVAFEGVVVVAAVGDPFERLLTFAEKGGGTFIVPFNSMRKEKRVQVTTQRSAKESFAEVDALFNQNTAGPKSSFLHKLSALVMNVRMTGSNILAGSHVAQGRVDVWLMDAVGGFWDIAPGLLLITEAGGKVTDLDGNIPGLKTPLVLGTNGAIHDAVAAIVQECYVGYRGFR